MRFNTDELRAIERIGRIHAKTLRHAEAACVTCGKDSAAFDSAFQKLRSGLERRRFAQRAVTNVLARFGLTLRR